MIENMPLTNAAVSSMETNGPDLFAGTDNGVYLSTDSGTSWTTVNNGLPPNLWYRLFRWPERIFRLEGDSGFFFSTNDGANWKKIDSGLTGDNLNVLSLVVNGPVAFVGTESGVFRLATNGASWISVDSGLPPYPEIGSLAMIGTKLLQDVWLRYFSINQQW